jgi:hypothetical protein
LIIRDGGPNDGNGKADIVVVCDPGALDRTDTLLTGTSEIGGALGLELLILALFTLRRTGLARRMQSF